MPSDPPEPSPAGWRTIAVLPFFDLSPEGDLEYLASGISEETIGRLSRFRELRVVACTSVLQFRSKPLDVREIGRQLEVGAVLEGSVRKAGRTLRISAQLIEVASGYVVWSEIHECALDDCPEVQKKASQAVVRRMRLLIAQAKREIRDSA